MNDHHFQAGQTARLKNTRGLQGDPVVLTNELGSHVTKYGAGTRVVLEELKQRVPRGKVWWIKLPDRGTRAPRVFAYEDQLEPYNGN